MRFSSSLGSLCSPLLLVLATCIFSSAQGLDNEGLLTARAFLAETSSLHPETTTEEYEGVTCLYKETTDGYACEIFNSLVRADSEVKVIDGEEATQPVEFVYARESRLAFIPNIIFDQFPELTKVELTNVGMLKINQIKNCAALTHLNLADNEIKDLTRNTFENCANLTEIYLDGNAVPDVSSGSFVGLENLKTFHLRSAVHKISLDHWPITINALTFQQLKSVTEFKVSMIRQSDFTSSLQQMVNIEVLHLDLNKIRSLEDRTFLNLWKMKELSLKQNLIATISENAFISLTMLTSLDLSENLLTNIPPTFQSLKVITIINLDNNEINFFNQLIEFPRIRTFSAVDNRIGAIDLRFFWPSLETLELSGNVCVDKDFFAIENFEDEVKPQLKNCFDHFVKETFCIFQETSFGYSCRLTLDHETNGEIDELERAHLGGRTDADVKCSFLKFEPLRVSLNIIFEKFTGLEKIELWGASIEALPLIQSCEKVQIIDLRLNSFPKLQSETFLSCSELTTLTLLKNGISELELKAFDGLNKLRFLDLSFNAIEEIPMNIFDQMSELKTLRVNGNHLRSMNWIASFPSLEILQLSSNLIESANLESLKSLKLRELHLNDNKISEILSSQQVFSDLRYLNLERNELSTLSINAESFPDLRYFDISENKIRSINSNLTALSFLQDFHATGNLCVDNSVENIEDFERDVLPIIRNCQPSK